MRGAPKTITEVTSKLEEMFDEKGIKTGSKTVYTNDYIERSETPIYEGGMSAELEFQEVISQSATQDEPLGTLA